MPAPTFLHNFQYTTSWNDPEVSIQIINAAGGVGKSALVNRWLKTHKFGEALGAQNTFTWSFYNQATSELGTTATDFIREGLQFFNDDDPDKGSETDKGIRLANLVKASRSLVILDGLEPLQYPPNSPKMGDLYDPSLKSFLYQIANSSNPGLCLITSRLQIPDLEFFDSVKKYLLTHLSPTIGAKLLKALGVKGKIKELAIISDEYNGHCLALTLLGNLLRRRCEGNPKRRDIVGPLLSEKQEGGHARRVMAAYETWFSNKPELLILEVIGIFDRPVEKYLISKLRSGNYKSETMNTVRHLSESDWTEALSNLRDVNLIASESSGIGVDMLDTHPLIREYFGERLQDSDGLAWKEANQVLYLSLAKESPTRPQNLKEMMPLYRASRHGCNAGYYTDVLNSIYRERVLRENYFSIRELGSFSEDLELLSNFFSEPWNKLIDNLSTKDKAFVLSQAGFCLRGLGRQEDATSCGEAALQLYIDQENWKQAAIVAEQISEAYVLFGRLTESVSYGKQAIEFADRSQNGLEIIRQRGHQASLLAHIGRGQEAEDMFAEVDALDKDLNVISGPNKPAFDYWRCYVLQANKKYLEGIELSSYAQNSFVGNDSQLLFRSMLLLFHGKFLLFIGRKEEDRTHFLEAEKLLIEVEHDLNRFKKEQLLPRCFTTRAEIAIELKQFEIAKSYITQAQRLIERNSMHYFNPECKLAETRLYLAIGDYDSAKKSLASAEKQIATTNFQMFRHEVDEIRDKISSL